MSVRQSAEMTPERWARTKAYLCEVFGREDATLGGVIPRALSSGLPDIAVDSSVGRLISLLCGMTNAGRGARLALELGTLAGYSGVWIARGLGQGGRLITVEPEAKHAAFARETFAACGVGDRVEIRQGFALDEIARLARERGAASLDFVFLDAVKQEYPAYFEALGGAIAPGGLLVADNALGGSWWIDEVGVLASSDPTHRASRDAVDRFNRAVAADDRFDAACVPLREGLLIARRR